MIARTTPGTHNPRISAQTETNRLREIGERSPYTMYVYMRRFFFGLVYKPASISLNTCSMLLLASQLSRYDAGPAITTEFHKFESHRLCIVA